MTQLTWNEYLDEVIKRVRGSYWGICTCNNHLRNIIRNDIYFYKLAEAIDNTPFPKEYTIYKWPIQDRQSRIDFLNSLKDKE